MKHLEIQQDPTQQQTDDAFQKDSSSWFHDSFDDATQEALSVAD